MMNSYEDVPYIYQKNLLSEESKMMSMRSFGKLRPDSCTILEIRGVPLKQPLPVVKEKNVRRSPNIACHEASPGWHLLDNTTPCHELFYLRAKHLSSMFCATLAKVMSRMATSFLGNCCLIIESNGT